MTVREWSEQWLRENAPHWKWRTERNYRSRLRCDVWPVLGDVGLDIVDRRMVRALLVGLRERGLAASTVRLVLATVRACLQAAVEADLIHENPARELGRVVLERRDAHAVSCPTQAEVQRMLDVAQTLEPQWFPLLLTLARTGLRVGEACGLRWEDLDLDARTALVRRTVGSGLCGEDSPKSGQARVVDLSAGLVAVLRALPRDSAWVFHRPHGAGHVDQERLNEVLRRCAAGCPGHWTAHQLRHAYASALLSRGVSLEYVARQLGHRSTLLCSTVYGRHLPAHHPELVDLLDAG